MKINKYGKMVIKENDILVTGFEIEGGTVYGLHGLEGFALEWAYKRLGDELYAMKHRNRPSLLRRLFPKKDRV